jgi:hypothetical protein
MQIRAKKYLNFTLDARRSHPLFSVVVTRLEVPFVALIPDYNRVGKKLLQTDYSSVNNL